MDKNEITVNDGKGLFDNLGLIDTLIVDCNNLQKQLITGNYVGFCVLVVEMVQKLSNLKKGVADDTESLMKQVRELTTECNRLANLSFNNEKGES